MHNIEIFKLFTKNISFTNPQIYEDNQKLFFTDLEMKIIEPIRRLTNYKDGIKKYFDFSIAFNDNNNLIEKFIDKFEQIVFLSSKPQRISQPLHKFVEEMSKLVIQYNSERLEGFCKEGKFVEVIEITKTFNFSLSDSQINDLSKSLGTQLDLIASKQNLNSREKYNVFLQTTGLSSYNMQENDKKLLKDFFELTKEISRTDLSYKIQEFIKELISSVLKIQLDDKSKLSILSPQLNNNIVRNLPSKKTGENIGR